jgi:hypothetical protein
MRLGVSPQALRRRPGLVLHGWKSVPVAFSGRAAPALQTANRLY